MILYNSERHLAANGDWTAKYYFILVFSIILVFSRLLFKRVFGVFSECWLVTSYSRQYGLFSAKFPLVQSSSYATEHTWYWRCSKIPNKGF